MKIKKQYFLWIAFIHLTLSLSCKDVKDQVDKIDEDIVWEEIQQEINIGVEATRTKNIEAYMRRLPIDLILKDESGEIITRERQREYALRDWSIIDSTLNIFNKIDSLEAFRDSATVYTSQRWERLMFQRDGITVDTVLTTQIHKELWKKNTQGWQNYTVKELGGEVFINGEKYNPENP